MPSGTYLVLSSDSMPGGHDYRIEMLKNNSIPGLMACKVSMEEGKTLLHYDITGRQTLATLFSKKMLGEEQVRDVIKGICRVFDSLVMYMLDVGGVLFDADYIYMNLDDGSMEFAYVPDFSEDGYGAVHALAEFLIGRVDHRDKKATRIAYDLFEITNKDDYTLAEIRNILKRDESLANAGESALVPVIQKTGTDVQSKTAFVSGNMKGVQNNNETDKYARRKEAKSKLNNKPYKR